MSKKVQYKLTVKTNTDKMMKLKQLKEFQEIKNISSQKTKKGVNYILFQSKTVLSTELIEFFEKIRDNKNFILEEVNS